MARPVASLLDAIDTPMSYSACIEPPFDATLTLLYFTCDLSFFSFFFFEVHAPSRMRREYCTEL